MGSGNRIHTYYNEGSETWMGSFKHEKYQAVVWADTEPEAYSSIAEILMHRREHIRTSVFA